MRINNNGTIADKEKIVFANYTCSCGADGGCALLFVNRHTSDFVKIEVRFYNSNLIHSQILAVLREKLLAVDVGVSAKKILGKRT
ncbi:unnamed protein product [marine sediment metagenome]|uniref:Uncharacterized protein n=1 Tax=marine sediment metagenome TaxID=412755 RepID=X1D7Y5_9ZZZZ